jgi:hypothetical protein
MKWTPVFELIGFFGLLGAIPFVAWTKMTLGAVLTLAGAYFSHLRPNRTSGGALELDTGRTRVRYSGGLSLFVWGCVSIAGLILIFSAGLDSKAPIEVAMEEKMHQVRTPGTKEDTGTIISPLKAEAGEAASTVSKMRALERSTTPPAR